jgi:hypothetical protein
MSNTVTVSSEFGPLLIGRDLGARIRERFFAGEPTAWPRRVSLKGVEQATESCLDEVFGTLAKQHGVASLTGLIVVDAIPTVSKAVKYVFEVIRHPPPTPTPESIRHLIESEPGRRKGKA